MDKNAIKKFAVWARRELIEKVTQKAAQYEVVDGVELDPNAKSVNGKLLSDTERKQRSALGRKIRQDGFSQVMEEVAYTWFNRFIALRFMEVNGYLPTHVRIFTDDDNSFRPKILSEAINLDIDGLDKEKVYALKDASEDEELFRYLLITQCNALNSILPGMFQKIADYTELLLPDYLLREGSVIEQMIAMIPEEDWTDQVQIIGWLYQYYNSEPKDDVFSELSKSIRITKDKIPAATQLFTPDWIVRYMVENSLGRLWLEGHPANKDKFIPTHAEQDEYIKNHNDDGKWHYYLEEAEQEPEVQKQLDEIHQEYSALKPEDILCIDPCMGSGHILCYLFDTLVKIYEDYGYSAREAASMIVENNIWGLDIDDRAAQLAYFAVMMKARQYDRRFFTRCIQPHVYAIQESNHINKDTVAYFANGDADLQKAIDTIISELHDAKEYGSILTVTEQDFPVLYARFDEIRNEDMHWSEDALTNLLPLVECAQALSQKYHVVVTNPPYLGNKNLDDKLTTKCKNKRLTNLYQMFLLRKDTLNNKLGICSIITMDDWLKKSKSENLRKHMLQKQIIQMVDLGTRAFPDVSGEILQVVVTVIVNMDITHNNGIFLDLTSSSNKEKDLIQKLNVKILNTKVFDVIPRHSIAINCTANDINLFSHAKLLGEIAKPLSGMTTGDRDIYIHSWYEVEYKKIERKWFHVNAGGKIKKWYGNNYEVINWENDGYEIKNRPGSTLANMEFQRKTGLTWPKISSKSIGVKLSEDSFFTASGLMAFPDSNNILYIMALMNCKICSYYIQFFSGGIDVLSGDVANIPVVVESKENVDRYSKENLEISRVDWDCYETSCDFKGNPMVLDDKSDDLISNRYKDWKEGCNTRFTQLKQNEEELNRIFIDIYGLQDELTPEESDKDVTIHRVFDSANEVPEEMKGSNYVRTKRDEIVSFISYAVGCMFGRYRLDRTGLAFAGGDWEEYLKENPYPDSTTSDLASHTFLPDKDAIIPICDDEYFSDDIVGRFVEFVRVVYGADTLEENLRFIADALGGDGTSRDVIRSYFMNDFYKDHCKTYQKRPIYWQFDSGKKNGFKCLVYMHRYRKDTIARIRTDYVYEQQSRYDTAIEDVERRLVSAEGSDKVKLNKRLKKLTEQFEELHNYEEKIHHLADQMISIDLDDGVKHNYAIFQDVLAKIK